MPKKQPTLETERLILRPFLLSDAPIVQKLAGDYDIALNTLAIPHPYEDGMAEEWIRTHRPEFEKGKLVNFAVVDKKSNMLIGAISLNIKPEHERAELGYWVGKPYWNNGYCTEAARAVLGYGFDAMNLNIIYAYHLTRNPSSGKVMQKNCMKYIATFPQWIKKWGETLDIDMYLITKSEFEALQTA